MIKKVLMFILQNQHVYLQNRLFDKIDITYIYANFEYFDIKLYINIIKPL